MAFEAMGQKKMITKENRRRASHAGGSMKPTEPHEVDMLEADVLEAIHAAAQEADHDGPSPAHDSDDDVPSLAPPQGFIEPSKPAARQTASSRLDGPGPAKRQKGPETNLWTAGSPF